MQLNVAWSVAAVALFSVSALVFVLRILPIGTFLVSCFPSSRTHCWACSAVLCVVFGSAFCVFRLFNCVKLSPISLSLSKLLRSVCLCAYVVNCYSAWSVAFACLLPRLFCLLLVTVPFVMNNLTGGASTVFLTPRLAVRIIIIVTIWNVYLMVVHQRLLRYGRAECQPTA